MAAENAEAYLSRAGVPFKRGNGRNGPELIIACPECGKRKCSVNATTWAWHCFAGECDAKGGEHSLKRSHGNVYDLPGPDGKGTWEEHRARQLADALIARIGASEVERDRDALQHSPSAGIARDYLQGRGISLEVARRLGLGWRERVNGATSSSGTTARIWHRSPASTVEIIPGWVTIPACTRHLDDRTPALDSCVLVKARRVGPSSGPKYQRLVGGESVLYAPCGINPEEVLLIVGGELDAVSCVQAGWRNVVSGTNGEPAWSPLWTRQLADVERIVVVYDNDEVGQESARKVVEALGPRRAKIGRWPSGCKDANDALVSLGEEFDCTALEAICREARSLGVDGMVRMADIRDEFIRSLTSDAIHGWPTGWRDLDDLVGGWRPGEVTVVTGDTGSGKTTFTAQAALFFALHHGSVLYCPFEMGAKKQTRKWVSQVAGANLNKLKPEQIDRALDLLCSLPLFVFWRSEVSVEALANTIVYAAEECGVRFVVIDHLHWLLRSEENSVAEISNLTKAIARAAVMAGVHILLVAHPHAIKTEGKHRDNAVVQLGDLKGGSSIKQDADNALSIWRPRTAERDTEAGEDGLYDAVLYSLKQRDEMGLEGSAALRFDTESARFLEPIRESDLFSFGASKSKPSRPSWTVTHRGASAFVRTTSRASDDTSEVEA